MILDDMVETMRYAKGVGLAAPQIGMMRRMFVAEPAPGKVYCFVNPEIVQLEGSQESEGMSLGTGICRSGRKAGKNKDQVSTGMVICRNMTSRDLKPS